MASIETVKAVDIGEGRLHTPLRLTNNLQEIAQVAELVDALASGASGRKVVEVRVFSWAPTSKLS